MKIDVAWNGHGKEQEAQNSKVEERENSKKIDKKREWLRGARPTEQLIDGSWFRKQNVDCAISQFDGHTLLFFSSFSSLLLLLLVCFVLFHFCLFVFSLSLRSRFFLFVAFLHSFTHFLHISFLFPISFSPFIFSLIFSIWLIFSFFKFSCTSFKQYIYSFIPLTA